MRKITDLLKSKGIICTVGEIKTFGGGFYVETIFSGNSSERENLIEEGKCIDFFSKYNRFSNKNCSIQLENLHLSNHSAIIIYLDDVSKKPLELVDPYTQKIIWKLK